MRAEPSTAVLQLALLVGILFAGVSFAQDPIPLGSHFQVNTITSGAHDFADVGFDSQGRFLVSWTGTVSAGDDNSHRSIQAQGLDNPGFIFVDGFESGNTLAWSDLVP